MKRKMIPHGVIKPVSRVDVTQVSVSNIICSIERTWSSIESLASEIEAETDEPNSVAGRLANCNKNRYMSRALVV